ncbi:protein-tyrosine phosphatase-like protein, partial [Microdochium trichocladiopsis]
AMSLSRVPGPDRLFVGGVWALNMESQRQQLHDEGITHVLSVIKYSFDHWGEEAKRFPHHLSIDIDDDEDMDLLAHLPDAVRFIDQGLYPPAPAGESSGTTGGSSSSSSSSRTEQIREGAVEEPRSPGAVYVHCAMGKSRSVSCVIAYLLWKYPHRFGGGKPLAASTPAERRASAAQAVDRALELVRQGRSIAEPNDGFMDQLRLWWVMGCPAGAGGQLENHPAYQKWLYERLLKEARDAHVPPDAGHIRFEDEVVVQQADPATQGRPAGGEAEVRCKKCRRTLATPKFVVSHGGGAPPAASAGSCAHVFIDTLSWMRPALEDGALEGRLNCPNAKCGATVGRFAWQGMMCSCKQWVVPAFSLNRSRVDELV